MNIILFISVVMLLTNPCKSLANPAASHYNKGTQAISNNTLGPAILHLEKAKKIAPRDLDIRHNLSYARAQLVDPLVGKPTLAHYISALIALLTLEEWLLLLSGSQAIFVLLHLLKKPSHRLQKITFLICAIPTLIALISNTQHYVIVISNEADLKPSPSHALETNFKIHEGVKAKILNEDLDWVKIKCQNGITGWVEKRSLAKI